jgi:uncharacterized Zn ribbon protein
MKKCPNCDAEDIDEDLAEEGICSECGEEFDADEAEDDEDDEGDSEDSLDE